MKLQSPIEGTMYYYISLVDGQGVVLRKEHKSRNIDYLNLAVGNYFKSFREAESAMPKYIAYLKECNVNPKQVWRETDDKSIAIGAYSAAEQRAQDSRCDVVPE